MMSEPTRSGMLVGGRYELVEILGQGGMGTVWRARDRVLRRDVAIKEVRFPGMLSAWEREVAVERALREARAAAGINHPNVITVYDVVRQDERPWIVMEYLPCRSLGEIVTEEGPMRPERAASVGLALLKALRAAHRAGVQHRDVKPSNVLIRSDDQVVLTDFGIAAISGDASLTRSGVLLGAPGYIAPERARGEAGGPSADLWSLGATLYAAVEGRPLYDRGTALATLTAIVTEEVDPPLRAGALRPVLDGLLRRDPSRRIDADRAAVLLRRAARRSPSSTAGHAVVPAILPTDPAAPSPRRAALLNPHEPSHFHVEPDANGWPSLVDDATPADPPQPSADEPQPTGDADQADQSDQVDQVDQPDGAGEDVNAVEVTERPDESEDVEAAGQAPGPDEVAEAEPASPAKPARSSALEFAMPASSRTPPPASTADAAEAGSAEEPSTADTPEAEESPVPPAPVPRRAGLRVSLAATPPGGSKVGSKLGGPVDAGAGSTVVVGRAGPEVTVAERLRAAVAAGGQGLRGRRLWYVVAAAVAVLVLVGVLIGVFSSGSGNGSHPRAKAGTGAGARGTTGTHSPESAKTSASPPASPSASAAASPSGPVVPAGFHLYKDPTGFSIAVPDGWQLSHDGHLLYVRDPNDSNRYLMVDQSDQPKSDPVADWTQQESERSGGWPGYQRIKIVAVSYFEKAADWEFTYTGDGGATVHVVNRGVVTSPHQAYGLYWQAPNSEWQADLPYWNTFTSTLVPAS
jgi:serine/threonine protein kinase